ncbi:hypothetical protein GCM10010112_58590 [Actinoplanes lobatus]|uniref:Uncharacterized protein n=1 Tax=Actinoplanes lobatus TaxID=113568 RepID=A0A7W7HQH3_9ACTN|nr:hypothetical protein [Actinoplanes lobatus]MBB4754790.1 hypothetical protein [Actinoplanes lobatus]GGN81774.1 hypothetical protein GCM10010112_58590 [Actinoplanes lobatus]GIE43079.1 hypothetical protein Alo02nite_59770 [Actinoplanes lobatus]
MTEETATERRRRFGELPARIRPEDHVELVDIRRPEGRPATALDPEHERALHTAA